MTTDVRGGALCERSPISPMVAAGSRAIRLTLRGTRRCTKTDLKGDPVNYAYTRLMAVAALTVAALTVALAVPAGAHHGFAVHYDPNSPVRIEGTVVRFDFRNPHSSLMIEARDEAGSTALWTCEMASRGQLARRGVTEDSYQPGEAIIVEGVAARRDPLGCEFGASTHADGRRFRGPDTR